MAEIKKQMGEGFADGGLYEVLKSLRADLSAVRTAVVDTLTKLDADAGVTDTDYSDNAPAALTTTVDT